MMTNDTDAALDDAMAAVIGDIPGLVAEEPEGGSVDEAVQAALATDGVQEVAPEEAAGSEEEVESSEPAEMVVPEGYVAPDVLTDGLVTEFVVRDAEGEVEIPNLTIEYKANGKVRQDRLDQVVKLAQWGVYNEQKFAAEVQQYQAAVEEREALLARREAELERLLTDDEFYDKVREAYVEETSPERRAERAEEEAQRAREQVQWLPIQQQGEQLYAQEIVPAMQMIAKQLHTVSEAELEQRVERALLAMAVPGPGGRPIVPPNRYDELRQFIVEDLAPWAQAVHARRVTANAPAQPKAAPAAVDQRKVDAQRAKRQVGQVLRPVGGSTNPAPSTPKKPAPATVDDAMEAAMADILSGLG